MPQTPVSAWLELHDGIIDRLHSALLGATGAAGDVGRAVDAKATEEKVTSLIDDLGKRADHFLDVLREAASLPAIPDRDTDRHFRHGVARWRDAAETEKDAAARRDVAEIDRSGRAYDAGTSEFYRCAAALRRATGQAPDPNNPLS